MSDETRRSHGKDGYGGSRNVNGYGDYEEKRAGSRYQGSQNMKGGKKKHTFGDFLRILLMLVALAVFCYSAYMLYTFYREYKKGSDEYDNLELNYTIDDGETENMDALEDDEVVQSVSGERKMVTVTVEGEEMLLPVMNNPIDFKELQSINTDIRGWLRIRALDISYPLVQAEDNDFYLHRTFEKEDNFAGCLFVNCDNEPDFTDTNTIIYGHNMKNGSMFGKLKQFADPDVFDKSRYFWIFTPDFIYQYRIFSAMVVNKTGLTYQTSFWENEYQEFLDTAFKNSQVDNTDVDVTLDDRVVTLSTCTGDDATRFVVIGKLAQTYVSKQSEFNK